MTQPARFRDPGRLPRCPDRNAPARPVRQTTRMGRTCFRPSRRNIRLIRAGWGSTGRGSARSADRLGDKSHLREPHKSHLREPRAGVPISRWRPRRIGPPIGRRCDAGPGGVWDGQRGRGRRSMFDRQMLRRLGAESCLKPCRGWIGFNNLPWMDRFRVPYWKLTLDRSRSGARYLGRDSGRAGTAGPYPT